MRDGFDGAACVGSLTSGDDLILSLALNVC